MSRISIINEVSERDTLPTALLTLALRLRGHRVQIVPFHYFEGVRLLRFGPDIIVVNGIRSTESFVRDIMMPKLLWRSRIVSLYSEQIGLTSDLAPSYNNSDILPHIDAHLAWGRRFAEGLLRQGVDRERVWITGSHRLDLPILLQDNASKLKDILSLECNLVRDRPWLLVPDNIIIRAGDSRQLARREAFDEFVERLAKRLRNWQVILRPHPATSRKQLTCMEQRFSGMENVGIVRRNHIALWAACSTALLTWASTSAVDAWAANTPVFAADIDSESTSYWHEGTVEKYRDPDLLSRRLADSLKEESKLKQQPSVRAAQAAFVKEWYFSLDGMSTLRTVDAIERTQALEPVPLKRDHKYPFRRVSHLYMGELKGGIVQFFSRGHRAVAMANLPHCHQLLIEAEAAQWLLDMEKRYHASSAMSCPNCRVEAL